MKLCKKCNQEKPFELFGKHQKTKDGFQYWCKNCNKTYLSTTVKYKTEESKKKKQAYDKEWRIANKAQKYSYDKAYLIDWRSDNPDKSAGYSAKRRSAKLNATPDWLTQEDWQEIELIYRLRDELEKQTGVLYHVDHIVPLQGENVCGLHVPWNLQVITASENISKSNKLLEADN